jgi:lysophospholipase L1-like esterase
MKTTTALLLILAAACVCRAEDADKPAPRTREYPWMSTAVWKKKHEAHVAIAKKGGVDLLFVGDSITEGWAGTQVWYETYAPRKAANFGIGGDTTQNVLWRLENGAGEGLSPKVVVLLIGTNNFGLHGDQPADVAKGVTAVVGSLRSRFPAAKILLPAVFPRDRKPDTAFRRKIAELNAAVAKLDDGKAVRFLDIGAKFLAADGTLPADVMPDALHLSEKGYRIWAEAMEPLLKELLGG